MLTSVAGAHNSPAVGKNSRFDADRQRKGVNQHRRRSPTLLTTEGEVWVETKMPSRDDTNPGRRLEPLGALSNDC